MRDIGTEGFCRTHLLEFFERVYALRGYGLLSGRLRPEYGPGIGDLECNSCGATWTGPICEPCPWCIEQMARMEEWQRKAVLTPPEFDPDESDEIFANRMSAWATRMKVQVKTYLISQEEADIAFRRTIRQRMESRRDPRSVHAGLHGHADRADERTGSPDRQLPVPDRDAGAAAPQDDGAHRAASGALQEDEPW